MDDNRIKMFDLHCDTLSRITFHGKRPDALFVDGEDEIPGDQMASLAGNAADIDLLRMRDIGYCQCFAIFVPDNVSPDESWQCFNEVHDTFLQQKALHGSLMQQVIRVSDIRDIIAQGKTAAVLTVEGASFVVGDLSRLHAVIEAGVKMITLTWNGPNAIASGNKTSQGLTNFGREVIRAMEASRTVVDVSHMNDTSFWDTMRASERPLAASHSNSRAICDHPRNLTDDMFRAIIERGGIVGLGYCPFFIAPRGTQPTPDHLLRHVDHFLNLGGENALCLGSDYDGCNVPDWLRPANKATDLRELFAREFGADIVDKIFFENAACFFERNEVL